MLRKIDSARSWALAKAEHAAVVSERDQLRRDLTEVRRQRDDAISALRELRDAVRARIKAEDECRALYRQRAIARADATTRDPAKPLN